MRASVPAIDTGPIRKLTRSRWRRIAKISGGIIGTLVMLVVLFVAFLHTPWGKSFVRGRVEKALAKKVNGTVRVGSLDYGFLFDGIAIGDVEIRDAKNQRAIAIGSIDLAIDRGALLDREVIIDNLAIAGLDVATANAKGLFKKSKSKPLAHVQIKNLSMTGKATIAKPDKTTTIDLRLTGAVDARPALKQVELALDGNFDVAIASPKRDVVIDDLALNVVMSKTRALQGAIRLGDTHFTFDGVADPKQLELALSGHVRTADIRVTRGKQLPAVETDLRATVHGETIELAVGETRVDKLTLDGIEATLHAKQGEYRIDRLAAHGLGFDITASGELVGKALDARVEIAGSPTEAMKLLGAAGVALPKRAPKIEKLDLDITAKGLLDGELAVNLAPARIALAGGSISLAGDATLDNKKLRVAHASVELRKLDLENLAKLAGRPPKAKGTLSGSLALTKTPTSRDARYDLSIALRDKPLTIAANGTANLTSATARIEARQGRDVLAKIAAKLPLDAKGFSPKGAWSVSIDIDQIASLAGIANKQLPSGSVHAKLAGSPARPTGTIEVAANKLALTAALAPAGNVLGVKLDGTYADLAKIGGTLAMPYRWTGKKLDVKALRAGLTVDAVIDIPDRALASLRPKLKKFDGTIGGRIAVHGSVKTPSIDATLAWRGYRTATGAIGETSIKATGTPTALVATIDHGGAKIIADVDRTQKDRIAIKARMRAAKQPLLPLLPAFAAAKIAKHELGTLDWNMDGDIVLAKTAGHFKLDQMALSGNLDVKGGAIKIPNSNRRYHDIALSIVGKPAGIAIESLSVREGKRTLTASGVLALDKARPQKLDLSLAARDWLVFGGEKFGLPDAPRATASFDIGVTADLTTPIPAIDATIRSLALRSPDRQERGHLYERASVSGDIIYIDSSTKAGKLPVARLADAAPRKRRPMDLRIHIPKAIRLEQTPMDVMARGDITVAVREEGVTTRGKLVMESGKLNLFGRDHALVDGSLVFTDEHPKGWLALTFERALPAHAMRELANPDAGARIMLTGSPAKPKTSLAGAANSAMFEVMAMYNAGRPVNIAQPGVPASSMVQAPRGDQLFVLTFLAQNLPHLLFLDRVSAWGERGHITNVEAEKYNKKSRVRAVVRPRMPGRSEAELQYDRMLIENNRAAFGVGVRAGDRVGGGVGLFFEWSSR